MKFDDITKVKSMTNQISEMVYVELKDRTVELEPGKSLYNVEVKNLSAVRPYMKIVENLTEVVPN
jgi:hypothetical protein